ncbi:MAG: response regulator [Terriglobia bacterium]|jgi:CheY-like chemotaxis protein
MSKRILIVDDSLVVLAMHKYALETAGYQCATAENGYLALELLFKECFALIVADVNMPRMDGYELARRIRKTSGYEFVPIILISSGEGPQDRAKGIASGANLYMRKPVEPAKLIANAHMLAAQRD